MRPKLTLKDLTFKLKEVPMAPPPPRVLAPKAVESAMQTSRPLESRLPQAVWCEMGKQWLRVVIDNRIGVGKRIFRIELYDATREKRLAIFRRQTEAVRQ